MHLHWLARIVVALAIVLLIGSLVVVATVTTAVVTDLAILATGVSLVGTALGLPRLLTAEREPR